MSDSSITRPAQLRKIADKLFEDAGYTSRELLDFITAFEELHLENERLKQELAKARGQQLKKVTREMSDRLRDALRE